MLIELVTWLESMFGEIPGAGLFNYLSFRAGLATILSLLISMVFGGRIIRWLQQRQVGESIRNLGLEGQSQKAGTPTMGGVIILMAVIIPVWLLGNLHNVYLILLIIAASWMAIIGFIDDYIKVFRKNKKGLRGIFKVLGQIGLGLLIAITMMVNDDIKVRLTDEAAQEMGMLESQQIGDKIYTKDSRGEVVVKADYKTCVTNLPFTKDNQLEYAKFLPLSREQQVRWVWLLFIPIVIFIVTAVSNGANLTDGLDGLATGVSGIALAALGILAYVSGNSIAANYLNILHLPGAGEMVVFAACLTGACLGFLWYNGFPAQIFMGDTGSLMLGSVIAAMGILLRKELLLPLLCGVFLIESLSVILQVSYFKYSRNKYGEGRRIFLMSPLHHHYQKKGYHEVKIVTRFWLVAILLAILTIITLKIR